MAESPALTRLSCPTHGRDHMVVLEAVVDQRIWDPDQWPGGDWITDDMSWGGMLGYRCTECGWGDGIVSHTADQGAAALRLMAGPGTFIDQ